MNEAASPQARAASRRVLGVAGLLLATGTMIGALGAHALRSVLNGSQLASLDTAVDYQLATALGLLAIGLLIRAGEGRSMVRIAWLLVAGVLCFSGGIYLMLAGAPRLFGFITPVGGVLLIVGWCGFAIAMLRGAAAAR